MKFTPVTIAVLVMMLRFSFIMAQTSDCQKKCEEAFIKCSGACASSTDTNCGATCIKDRDECAKKCPPVKPKPAPDINEDSDDNGEDDGDVDDDTDTNEDTNDTNDDLDSSDANEDDL
jgi:hypothetical protein